MDWLRGLLRRLRVFVRRGAAERELDDEIRLHIELETAAGVARGLSPTAARRSALHGFGGVDRFKDEARDARGWSVLDELARDARVAVRMLRRSPQFTLAAVVTLALGIGANTAIFTVVDAVLLRASPFADPERLVMIWETDRDSHTSHEPASWPDIIDLRQRSRTMAAIGAVNAMDGTLTGAGDPERIAILGVTANLPELLGVRPLLGRAFEPGDGQSGGARHALLGEEYWRRRFATDPGVVGTSLTIDGTPTTILGVLPAESDLGIVQALAKADYSSPLARPDVDVWLATEPTGRAASRNTHPFLTLGRLAPGATLAAAQRELAAIMVDLERAYPEENAARGVNLEPYAHVTFGPVRPALLVLWGAVALVMLVACVNVANLLLARSAARSREVAVRRALGAAKRRLAWQFLVESLVLTGVGAAAGVALAYAGLRVLIALAPPDIPRLTAATIDLRVLGFTALVAGFVAICFGMLPVWQARRLDLQTVLKSQTGQRVSHGREGNRFRRALIVSEVALAVALVIGAGLLLRSFWALANVDPGFNAAHVLKVEYELPDSRQLRGEWPDLPDINGFHAEFRRRVAALPGVQSAAVAAEHPLYSGLTNSFVIVGREAESEDWPEIRVRMISPGYLETLGVPLLAGRAVRESDVAGTTPVAVINRIAAERYFSRTYPPSGAASSARPRRAGALPGSDPIGQHIGIWGIDWQIAGVMGNEHFNGLDQDVEPAIYAPLGQMGWENAVLLVRTSRDPRTLTASIRSIVAELEPRLALFGIEPLAETLATSIARPRFTATLLALFGGVAILLALVGVHGVLSYNVARRAPEVGLRMALGASRADVTWRVVREGAGLAAVGIAVGLAGALAASRTLAALVFGIHVRDTATFSVVAAAVFLIAALAAWLPARRAAKADPMQALRAE